MKLLLVKPENESVKEYTEDLDRWGITYEVMDFPITSRGLTDHVFNEAFCQAMFAVHGEKVDAIQFFSREWKQPVGKKIRGRMFNRFFSGYLISYTRLRKGYNDTARHELLHKVDNWVYVYLGILLENIAGVKDWDDCVVHAEDKRFKEYDYDAVWQLVRPKVMEAIAYRKNKALLGYLNQLLIKLRESLKNMQDLAIEVDDIDHPVPGFPITYKYGVADEAYPKTGRHIGTDWGTPVGTPIKAPLPLEVIQVGADKTMGNYCHCQYVYAGKTYQTRFLHLKTVPTRGKYQKGAIFAYTGNTGRSSGPHLHVDVWPNQIRTDLINRTNWNQLTIDPAEHFAG